MKIAIAILATFLVAGSLSWAYEIKANPDRRISIGLNYDRDSSTSDYKFGVFKISDFAKRTGNTFLADIKIPMSPFFTFQIRGGYGESTVNSFINETIDSKGYDVGFGFRLYLP